MASSPAALYSSDLFGTFAYISSLFRKPFGGQVGVCFAGNFGVRLAFGFGVLFFTTGFLVATAFLVVVAEALTEALTEALMEGLADAVDFAVGLLDTLTAGLAVALVVTAALAVGVGLLVAALAFPASKTNPREITRTFLTRDSI